ncbi:MAG: hypothetical protein F4110_12710 [Acidimicrobiaceae bacterium]|nr:hypothetical protein [Acidimicrobiaceae bacterium]MXZ98384.1 hypothetical protein [Acidimicrobiaceae bacterium]MYE76081.1 hypothetical protein [Acidimicrobiaceae bacterium]MYE96710.1 hypothetical protein [Acidimicrobiaceae bacterium]MYH42555.1 hypothetical protein [Acidimicrobiaceae bacterium]
MEALLLVEALCRRGRIDAERAAPELQRRPEVASEAISCLSDARADGVPWSSRLEECRLAVRPRRASPMRSAGGCPTGSFPC